MKRVLAGAVFFAAVSLSCAASSGTRQIVVPGVLSVGDTAELTYTFTAPESVFPDVGTGSRAAVIPEGNGAFAPGGDRYTVTKLTLERSGTSCTLTVDFQPWCTGTLDFPQFDVAAALYGKKAVQPFMIDPEPVTVRSLLTKDNSQNIREPLGPALVPGTLYAVYAIAASVILLLVVIVRIIMKRQGIKDKWTRLMMRVHAARNKRKALARLDKLVVSDIHGVRFCALLESVIRTYLEHRYEYHFTSVVTSRIMITLTEITGGTMSESKTDAAARLVELLYRADHVRFAQGSAVYVPLGDSERSEMVSAARGAITALEEVGNNA